MTTWHYQVYLDEFMGEKTYSIKEVYVDSRGKPNGITYDDIAPVGSSVQELADTLRMMLNDIERFPVLTKDDVEKMFTREVEPFDEDEEIVDLVDIFEGQSLDAFPWGDEDGQ